MVCTFFFFKQKTAYDMRISDWSSDVCSSDLASGGFSANEQLRKAYIPYADQHVSILPYENVGDGMNMGLEVGASLGGENLINAVWEIGRASCWERVCQYV